MIIKRNGWKAALLALAAALCFAGCADKATPAAGGYDTPDAAMEAFAQKVAALDTGAALEMFSAAKKAEHFDFDQFVERIQAFSPISSAISDEYDAYAPLNKAMFNNQSAMQLKIFMLSFMVEGDRMEAVSTLEDMGVTGLELEQMIDPQQLAGLKLVRADKAMPELQDSDAHKLNVQNNGKLYGYKDAADYIALYELDGQHYMGGFTLVQYDDGWYVDSLTSTFAGTPATGRVAPITEQEYLDMLD